MSYIYIYINTPLRKNLVISLQVSIVFYYFASIFLINHNKDYSVVNTFGWGDSPFFVKSLC